MALPGETTGARRGQSFPCPDCNAPMPLKVLQSNAGYYLGHHCTTDDECGCSPWSRETGYYPSRETAQQALDTNEFHSR